MAIQWPGGGAHRPLEITLPKHMRVVVVEDPPFVYTVATKNAEHCAYYGTFVINDIDVVCIFVIYVY